MEGEFDPDKRTYTKAELVGFGAIMPEGEPDCSGFLSLEIGDVVYMFRFEPGSGNRYELMTSTGL
jgi:hypothetical protein